MNDYNKDLIIDSIIIVTILALTLFIMVALIK